MNRRRFLKGSGNGCPERHFWPCFSVFPAAYAADSTLPTVRAVALTSLFCNPWRTIWRKPVGWCAASAAGNAGHHDAAGVQRIRYDEKQSLWNNIEGRQLDAQFFHMGMGFRRRVRMFSLDQTTSRAREIHFRPELFSYGDTGVDTKQLEGQSDLGFAGFRVFKAPELARRDIVSFGRELLPRSG